MAINDDQCPYEKTVLAKKLNFYAQFYDKNGQLSPNLGLERDAYWQSLNETITNMGICDHYTRK